MFLWEKILANLIKFLRVNKQILKEYLKFALDFGNDSIDFFLEYYKNLRKNFINFLIEILQMEKSVKAFIWFCFRWFFLIAFFWYCFVLFLICVDFFFKYIFKVIDDHFEAFAKDPNFLDFKHFIRISVFSRIEVVIKFPIKIDYYSMLLYYLEIIIEANDLFMLRFLKYLVSFILVSYFSFIDWKDCTFTVAKIEKRYWYLRFFFFRLYGIKFLIYNIRRRSLPTLKAFFFIYRQILFNIKVFFKFLQVKALPVKIKQLIFTIFLFVVKFLVSSCLYFFIFFIYSVSFFLSFINISKFFLIFYLWIEKLLFSIFLHFGYIWYKKKGRNYICSYINAFMDLDIFDDFMDLGPFNDIFLDFIKSNVNDLSYLYD